VAVKVKVIVDCGAAVGDPTLTDVFAAVLPLGSVAVAVVGVAGITTVAGVTLIWTLFVLILQNRLALAT